MMVINCGTKSALHEIIIKYYSSLHTFAIFIFDCCPNVTSEIADFYNFFSRQFYSLLFGSTIPLIENEDPHWWAYKSALISTVCFFSVLNIADSLKWILKFSTRSALILIFSIFIMKSNENDRISCLTSSSWNEIKELIFGRKKRERGILYACWGSFVLLTNLLCAFIPIIAITAAEDQSAFLCALIVLAAAITTTTLLYTGLTKREMLDEREQKRASGFNALEF